MYLSHIAIENFRCFGEGNDRFEMSLNPGLTALVGENDTGKTAVIDAICIALGTTDQEWYRVEDSDFHREDTSRTIRIACRFDNLTEAEMPAFVEYLTYDKELAEPPALYVHWTAVEKGKQRQGRPYRKVEWKSGREGDGPIIDSEVRRLLVGTYLRPLRDAELALSARRGSRLAQILRCSNEIEDGVESPDMDAPIGGQNLSILGISNLVHSLLEKQKGIASGCSEINENLKQFAITRDEVNGQISISKASDDARMRELLEKLNLTLNDLGRSGLGSCNLLFMACELLLLTKDEEGNKLLLIEEPEAHLHAQRQLRVMKHMQQLSKEKSIQIIITTHSPNLASAIDLQNLIMIKNHKAFSMAAEKTKLEETDYRFLQRFLDVTKANLFFARGVVIVEGVAENILLPTIAGIIGRDFTKHGVSIVNVGGVGLRRYARIFQRNDEADGTISVLVACVTDMDVMPNCAPVIIDKIKEGEDYPQKGNRRWRAKRDFANGELEEHRRGKEESASGQCVKTFVSDEWTLEYDLALGPKDENGNFTGGLAEDVFVAVCLAKDDDAINTQRKTASVVEDAAREEFGRLQNGLEEMEGCSKEEVLASRVYAKLLQHNISKAVTAQYLAERLRKKNEEGGLSAEQLRAKLPRYLIEAIDYVTGQDEQPGQTDEEGDADVR